MSEFAGSTPNGSEVLAAAIDDLDDAVIVRDADSGGIVAVNDAVETVFGYAPATFRELDPHEYAVAPERAEEKRADAVRAARSGERSPETTFRWEVERGDETTIWAESAVSTSNVRGTPCVVSVVRDVTARTRRVRELERFAEVLTHDLRSPLNAAQAQVDILRSETSGGEEFLDRIERVHDRMSAIVDDVRTVVGDRQCVADPDRVDLSAAVADAWEAVGGDGTLVVAGDLGVVEADEGRLCRLFANLFENAIRHGGETDASDGTDDGVTVTVSSLPGGVAVADDGPGIPESERHRVFEYGYTSTADGTGFGLNIVAAAADAHGWDVDVCESTSGGARFEITGMDRIAERGPETETETETETEDTRSE
ncbi:MAG: ATP-binding protein [Haloquadratum sp.]